MAEASQVEQLGKSSYPDRLSKVLVDSYGVLEETISQYGPWTAFNYGSHGWAAHYSGNEVVVKKLPEQLGKSAHDRLQKYEEEVTKTEAAETQKPRLLEHGSGSIFKDVMGVHEKEDIIVIHNKPDENLKKMLAVGMSVALSPADLTFQIREGNNFAEPIQINLSEPQSKP